MKYLFFLLPILSFGQNPKVDFKTLNALVRPNAIEKSVSGKVTYTFEVLSKTDTIKIDAINMVFTDVKINNKLAKSKTSAKNLQLFEGFKKGKNTISFDYSAKPKQTLYFNVSPEETQIWTQGQGKNTSHWLPSFDDMNEKVIFNISVAYDKSATVISNGTLKSKSENDKLTTWNYQMNNPMSSYLVMIAAGNFDKKTETSASGIPLEMYYRPADDSKFNFTYKHSKAIFDFLETEIGVNYPWEIYKQIPVKDFLYAGMENTSATVFAQDYVVDEIAFNVPEIFNDNAHELAHQWFGDMVTAKSGKHHWLQEGFATYYALLVEQSLFGDDHFYNKLYEMAEELQRASKTDTIPLLNEKASSLTFYKKGAWALHVLSEGVGRDNFRKAVQNYLKKYAFKNVDTDEFLTEINKVSSFDTDVFRKKWLEKGGFEVGDAIELLKKNTYMKQYFDVLGMSELPFAEKRESFEKLMQSNAFYPLKEEIIFQSQNIPFDEKEALLKLAMQTNNIKIRQAVARSLTKIPTSFYDDYVSFLDDKSYVTQEIALNQLWQHFPKKQSELLDKTKSNIGFNDKNLRIQWLTLALMTKDYQQDHKVKFYDELLDYGTQKYESNVRQHAIENLLYINKSDTNVLPLLINPLTHYKWQFSKFARDKIRELIKHENLRQFFQDLLPTLAENEKNQLKRLLDEK